MVNGYRCLKELFLEHFQKGKSPYELCRDWHTKKTFKGNLKVTGKTFFLRGDGGIHCEPEEDRFPFGFGSLKVFSLCKHKDFFFLLLWPLAYSLGI